MSYSEAITKNDLKKILGNIGFGSLNDYIIEQGTSGIWTYRKWKSGVAECWGKRTVTVDITNSWGSLYVSTTNIKETYPTNLFVEAPTDKAALSSNYSGILMPYGSVSTSATATAERGILKGWSGANQVHVINYYSKGKWKNDIDTYQGIGSIGAVLLDTFHPVGSYYETSDANFNPNVAWGGTWNKETVFGDGKLLFNNDSAEVTQTSITLSESVENYGSVTVCYKDNDNKYDSVDISNPVNKTFGLIASWGAAANYLYYKTGSWKIGTTTLTKNWECEYAITTTPNVTRTEKNVFAITQVIGYRTMHRWHRTA